MSNLFLSSPSLSGTLTESSLYQVMGVGITDTILLLGHADANTMYEPFQVLDIKKAVSFLGGDSQSPLVKALLESYNIGCKDIWIMAVAPMSEYEPTISERLTAKTAYGNKTFYERYYQRLTDAYAILSQYDFPEIVVPVEAVFYESGTVDFVKQLVDFCENLFVTTGSVCLGVLGTRINTLTDAAIDTMVNDTKIKSLGSAGKFVMVVMGEGILSQSQLAVTYPGSLATTVAAVMATAPLDRSVIGIPLPNVSALIGNDLTYENVEKLSNAKINVVSRTTRGKRGYSYQTRLMTDNTLGDDGSDFWSMSQMHIVANIVNQIRSFGFSYIGTVYLKKFKEAVFGYLNQLASDKYIKQFTLNITEEDHGQKALVYVSVIPIFGIRQITFQVEVGPGT